MDEQKALQPIIEQIYDIVVDPVRLERLCDLWCQHLQSAGDESNFALFGDPFLLPHVEKVETALRHLSDAGDTSGDARSSPSAWVSAINAAALISNAQGEIVAANTAARATLGISVGQIISDMPVNADELNVLGARLALTKTNGNSHASDPGRSEGLLRLRLKSKPVSLLIRLVPGAGGNEQHTGLVTTMLAWPRELSPLLQKAFGLTAAECEVLKFLALGFGVRDIAVNSNRSEPTVRSHVSAILAKTETNSQIELIRLTIGLMDGFQPQAKPAAISTGDPTGNGNTYQTLILNDGRRLDYLMLGDAEGAPFLLFHSDAGSTRLPASAENDLVTRRLLMIVPIRAGFGWSSPIPSGRQVTDVAVDDTCQLMDHLGIARAPIFSICEDLRIAVEMACRHPDRISAAVATGAIMPAHTPQHYARMTKFARFIMVNARYAPRTLPYIALAFYSLARRIGPKRFLQTVMAESAGDRACLAQDEIADALIKGSEISMRPGFTAHEAWAAHAVANFDGDWSQRLRDCPVPLVLFHGHQDPYSPFETVKEYAAELPGITLFDYPQYGQLLYPVWPQIADALANHVVR